MDGQAPASLPDRTSDDAAQALDLYDDAYLDSAVAEEVRHAAKERLLALPPRSISAATADNLYWNTDVPVTTICHLLGVKKHVEALLPEIGPGSLWSCAAGHAFPAATRSQRDALIAGRGHCLQCRTETSEHSFAALAQQRDERVAELRSMRYQDYLRSPEWQATRVAALKRARFRCQMCGAQGARLNVHHNTYERRGEELASDVIAICELCHRLHHGIEVDA